MIAAATAFAAATIAEAEPIQLVEHVADLGAGCGIVGIAAALAPEDTPGAHKQDTLVAGAGLCSEPAVDALVTEMRRVGAGLPSVGQLSSISSTRAAPASAELFWPE